MDGKFGVFVLVLLLIFFDVKSQEGCSILDSYCFDCYFEVDVDEQKCLNCGCCWRKVIFDLVVDGEVLFNVLYCFYFFNYGYQIESKIKI